MHTLYMTQPDYDLTLDSSRNIAMASEPYALAQDAASAIRTFKGEVYYNTLLGVPYFESILNHAPPLEYCRSEFIAAAMTVPEVLAARVFFTAFTERQLSGQVQITSSAGVVVALGF